MSKKKLIVFIIMLLCTISFNKVYADESIDSNTIESIIEEQAESENINEIFDVIHEYAAEDVYKFFNDISFENMFKDALTGKFVPDVNNVFKGVINFIVYELKKNIAIIIYILVISVFYSIIGSLADSSGYKGVKDVTGYVYFGTIIMLVLKSYMEVINSIGNMMGDLSGFVMSVTPLLITLLSTGGSVVGAATMSPIILFCSQFCAVAIDKYFLPVSVTYGLIGMAKSISTEIKLDKLCGMIKSLCIWPLGVILTIFTFILSIQKSIASSGDGLTVKFLKNLLGVVPVVGGRLSEATSTVMNCLGIVRTASGTIIMICIAGIAALPILRTVILAFIYKAASAICELVCEDKYSNIISFASDSLFMIAGICAVMSLMFLIIMAIIIGTGNSTLMISS